jgi:RimJ/RimL family protein N-acetyltransferase
VFLSLSSAAVPGEPPPDAYLRQDKDGVAYRVRAIEGRDRAALEEFYDVFVPQRAAQGLPPTGLDRIRRWLDSILRQGFHLLAFRGEELIGHAFVVPTGREGVGEYAIFLRADERGRGVGTDLNRLSIDLARQTGLRKIWLSVAPHNRAAIRSYENAGFRFLPGTIYSPETEMELEL